jgi:hypothetical protein
MEKNIYRLDIRYPRSRGGIGDFFKISLTCDDGLSMSTVATCKSADKPKISSINAWLASKGYVAYGDLLQIGSCTLRSMVKKIS